MGVKIRKRKGMYRYLTFGLLTLLFTISMAITAYSGEFEDATAAYKRGDYGEAYRLIKLLAQQGVPEAQYTLGLMYATGQGGVQDYAEAVKWYRRAAERGYADAQLNLGGMYAMGQGVPQDDTEAAKWYRKAAEQGFARAQYNLGVMYYKGQGVPQDYVLAHMWFNLAVLQLPASEGKKREQAVKDRDMVASKMTFFQIAEAERLAREWKPKKEAR